MTTWRGEHRVTHRSRTYIMVLLMCDIVKLPVWLVQPGVCPVSVNVPEPDPIPIAMLPCMVMVFV